MSDGQRWRMKTPCSFRPSRRALLVGAAGSLLGASATAAPWSAQETLPKTSEPPPPPKYTLSLNLELMFPGQMPFDERLKIAADAGARAYSFWNFAGKDLEKLRALQETRGLRCASITGANKTGWQDGLTRTGAEKAFLDDFQEAVNIAKRLKVPNLITFVGRTQPDIPQAMQHDQIIAGLRKAGDIAGAAGVFLTLEPLNPIESPQMSVLSARHGFAIVGEVDHPHVKLDFDMYHLQLGEGNLTENLREGWKKGYIRFVEVGDVPGRFEPGTGEVNYPHIFRVLREIGYDGDIGMEHRASTTPTDVFQRIQKMAGLR